jgi:hypothetical protein
LYQPLDAAIAQAQQQKLNPQETEAYVMNLMFGEDGPVMKFLEPFVSEPLGFDRFIDVTTRNGRKDGGGSVYTKSDDLGDKFIKSLTHVLDGVKPGFITSGQKIGDALSKDLTKGGKPVNLSDELLALFTGTRIIRIDVKKDLRYFTRSMNGLLRAVDETEGFYSVQDFAQKTPTDTIKIFDNMQQEALRIQKDMYIRIKDLELLDLSKSKIYQIMKDQGASRTLVNNLISGRFTPVNYSKPRFESKIKAVKDQMRNLTKSNDEFRYRANRSFLFPQAELDRVKAKYSGIKFFPTVLNQETRKREGGYNPDEENYKVDKEGRLLLDENRDPILEDGFFKNLFKKGYENIKDNLILPQAPGFTSKPKIQTPPLGNTPMPSKQLSQAQNVDPITRLTSTETALLSPTEKVIASRT